MSAGAGDLGAAERIPIEKNVGQVVLQNDFQKVIAWTVDHRRLDGDETNLFAKRKSKRTPAGHQKPPSPNGRWGFLPSGIRKTKFNSPALVKNIDPRLF